MSVISKKNMHGNHHDIDSITCSIPDMDISSSTHVSASNTGTNNASTENKRKQGVSKASDQYLRC